MKEYLIRPGPLDRQRKLVLDNEYLEWENSNLKGNEFTRVLRQDIVDFSYGVDGIVWYEFVVGRKYTIAVKDKQNNVLRINFSSYFGLHKESAARYQQIMDDLWPLYHSLIVERHVKLFREKRELQILGIKLKDEGVELPSRVFIGWKQLGVKDYNRYFALYNQADPKIHATINYFDFGADTLRNVMARILTSKVEV